MGGVLGRFPLYASCGYQLTPDSCARSALSVLRSDGFNNTGSLLLVAKALRYPASRRAFWDMVERDGNQLLQDTIDANNAYLLATMAHRGAPLDSPMPNGMTPMHHAVTLNMTMPVQSMIAGGGNPLATSYGGINAFL